MNRESETGKTFARKEAYLFSKALVKQYGCADLSLNLVWPLQAGTRIAGSITLATFAHHSFFLPKGGRRVFTMREHAMRSELAPIGGDEWAMMIGSK